MRRRPPLVPPEGVTRPEKRGDKEAFYPTLNMRPATCGSRAERTDDQPAAAAATIDAPSGPMFGTQRRLFRHNEAKPRYLL